MILTIQRPGSCIHESNLKHISSFIFGCTQVLCSMYRHFSVLGFAGCKIKYEIDSCNSN